MRTDPPATHMPRIQTYEYGIKKLGDAFSFGCESRTIQL